MRYRLERLGSPAQPTRELRQYQAHKDALFEEAGILDARFDSASSRPVSTACRDKEFRDLLFRDLQATDLDRVSLAAQLGAFRVDPSQADEGRKLAKQMQRFVRNSNLVSVDTVRARIRRYGFDELEDSEDLQRRLLALYYQTYADDQTIIPATSKLLLDQVINYYDADIFWNVMSRMFGNHSRLLASLEIPEAAGALRRIRESDDWTAFTAMYFNTLQTVDETLWSQPDSVIRTFDSKNPPRSTTFILKRLWSRRKIDLAGAAFGAVALASSAAPFGTGEEIGATAAGIASIGLGGIGLVRYIHRFIEEYKSQDMMKVKDTIKREVHQVLAAIRSESRQTD